MMMVDEVAEKDCPFSPDTPLYMSWVDIHGYVSGALSIVAQQNFITTLTCNLLGLDAGETPSEADCHDALREMGNVLAGNYFTEAYGEDVVFDVINPNITEVPFEILESIAARRVKYYFVADESPIVITFSLRE